ncbi:MAG: phosphoribosylaminoimidazolesuccinocarboxamide synthase [Desulfobaccales bacterium]
MPMKTPVLRTSISEYEIFRDGKSRDVYDLGSELLIIATDRISAFDVIMPTAIPYKGIVLKGLCIYWFNKLAHIVKNHLITDDLAQLPSDLIKYSEELEGRSIIVRKTNPIMVECVVRGYLAGNGWKEYNENGVISGHKIPKGLVISEKLPEPIFTPAIKSESITGHDEYVTHEKAINILGFDLFMALKDASLRLYQEGNKVALENGIIIADTKYEFGLLDGELILIDELFTPDSSRFWPASSYKKGIPIDSLDKEYVRAYIINNDLIGNIDILQLPQPIINETTRRYIDIYEILTGKKFPYQIAH